MAKLTEDQIEKLGKEYRSLLDKSRSQLVEHRMYLVSQLTAYAQETNMAEQLFTQLCKEVNDIRIDYATVEEAIKQVSEGVMPLATVSVVWEYPDQLYAFMRQESCPPGIASSLKGGINLIDKPVIEGASQR